MSVDMGESSGHSVTVLLSRGGEGAAVEEAVALLCSNEPGMDVILAPHLYQLAEDSRLWSVFAGVRGDLLCLSWLHPRPAEWLLRRHAVQADRLITFSFGAYTSPETCFAAIRAAARLDPAAARAATVQELNEPLTQRWFPIIDASRCVNCQHCLQFCLFGVYEVDVAGKVSVANPDLCKSGCPACSRICPQGAIMFPLYARDQAIAGAPGTLMSPDLSARRMFYTRTKKACPECGSTGQPGPVDPAAPVCQECGRPIAPPTSPAKAPDDLDTLIEELDRRAKGRS